MDTPHIVRQNDPSDWIWNRWMDNVFFVTIFVTMNDVTSSIFQPFNDYLSILLLTNMFMFILLLLRVFFKMTALDLQILLMQKWWYTVFCVRAPMPLPLPLPLLMPICPWPSFKSILTQSLFLSRFFHHTNCYAYILGLFYLSGILTIHSIFNSHTHISDILVK